MFDGTFVTSVRLIFISLLVEKTVSAIKEISRIDTILKAKASLMIRGFFLLELLPPKLTKPLFIVVKVLYS